MRPRDFPSVVGSRLALLFLCLAALLPSEAGAHTPETSYLKVVIAGTEMRSRLTCDLVTLGRIVPLDDDRDRRVSREEMARHAPAVAAYLAETVSVESGGYPPGIGRFVGFDWPADAGASIAERDYHSALALVAFRFERTFEDEPEDVAFYFRFFGRVGERHNVLGTFLHGDEVTEVVFTRFEPDYAYVTGHETSVWRRCWQFLRMGVAHIFLGFDHLCFLAALILVARARDLLLVVTSFTVAHSCTLILAALDLVTPPGRMVEAGIAASIVYVAWENLSPRERPNRWILTFFFGLVHGFGFAEVLRGMSLPEEGLIRCLLSFNVGVECGQLAIVLCLFWPVSRLRARPSGDAFVRYASLVILSLGAAWLIDRMLGSGWMPF
ncbi:MAG: HupE/UreJ family protein [Verrucomicrobiota bacterium]